MLTIKSYMACKKPRRSNRLESKEREICKEDHIKRQPLGYFDILPIEIKYCILGYLSVEDLSMLTITSKVMRNLVEGYRVTSPVGRHLIPNPLPNDTAMTPDSVIEYRNKFHKLGLLVKRSTCLFTTRDRLKFINDYLSKMMCSNALLASDTLTTCLSWTCFGKFLHTVIAGWDDMECQKAFESICVHANIAKSLNNILTHRPGTHTQTEHKLREFYRRIFIDPIDSVGYQRECFGLVETKTILSTHTQTEYKLREFYRRIFLDPIDSVPERAFWLGRILKPFPMVHQARLLYLLYGPVISETILWHQMCENTSANNTQTTAHFGPLAASIQVLHYHVAEWNEDDIISVIDEMTCHPDNWLAENVACLLLLSGHCIMTKALVSKAINGRVLELSAILASLTLVCIKNGVSQSYVISLIHKLLEVMETNKERTHFLNCVSETFKEILLDLHEYSTVDDGPDSELMYMISALTEFTKKLLSYAYRDMITPST